MIKRQLSEYALFVFIFIEIFSLYRQLYLLAICVSILCYCLYGMVGLAFSQTMKRKIKRSDFLLRISIPVTLLPFRKAFYYWTKASNVILAVSPLSSEARAQKAYEIAGKVNVDALYTANNKSFFFCFFAALLNDMGRKEEALQYVEMSEQLPHRQIVDEALAALKKEIAEQNHQ